MSNKLNRTQYNNLRNIIFNKNNYFHILVCTLFISASQPMVAWSISLLSSVFINNSIKNNVIIKNIGILVLALIINWFGNRIKSNLILDSEVNLRKQIFSKIYEMPISEFIQSDSGTYYNQIGRDVQIISENVFSKMLNIVIDIFSILFISLILLHSHWLSFIIIIIFLMPLIFNNIYMPKKIAYFQDKTMDKFIAMTIKVKDVLNAFIPVKFSSGEKYIEESTFNIFDDITTNQKSIAKLSDLSAFIANTSVTISQFSGIFIAFLLLNLKKIDMTGFLLIFQMGVIINQPIIDLINSIISVLAFNTYIISSEKLLGKPSPKSNNHQTSVTKICFNNVSFQYSHNERYLLKNFNYNFERGKKYLIIGESGSGKSTLVKLLLGIVSPTYGGIFFDNINQKDMTHEEILQLSTIVPQQVYILDDTIRRNIDLKGDCSDEKIMEILQKVNLSNFLDKNSYTLDTRINSETLQVSGGEKARIGLARTLTLEKSIVVYDEVLSGLDNKNAEAIEELLLDSDNNIVIHIAHNSLPQFINRYDDIIDFNKL